MKFGIAIIGRREEILGFSAVGLTIFPAETGEVAREILFDLKRALTDETHTIGTPKFAIVFVMEEFIRSLTQEELTKLSAGALPSIISLPGNSGSTGYGNEKIRRIVEKAVGSDIFGNS